MRGKSAFEQIIDKKPGFAKEEAERAAEVFSPPPPPLEPTRHRPLLEDIFDKPPGFGREAAERAAAVDSPAPPAPPLGAQASIRPDVQTPHPLGTQVPRDHRVLGTQDPSELVPKYQRDLGTQDHQQEARHPSRQLREQFKTRLPREKIKSYKMYCLRHDVDIQEMVEQALDEYLERHPEGSLGTQGPGYPRPPRGSLGTQDPHMIDRSMIDDNKISSIARIYTEYTGRTPNRSDLYWMRRYAGRPLIQVEYGVVTTVFNKLNGGTAEDPIRSFKYCIAEIEKAAELGEMERARAALATAKKRLSEVLADLSPSYRKDLPPNEGEPGQS